MAPSNQKTGFLSRGRNRRGNLMVTARRTIIQLVSVRILKRENPTCNKFDAWSLLVQAA
jgi:hypothetical protein